MRIVLLMFLSGCVCLSVATQLVPCASYGDARYEPTAFTDYPVPNTTKTSRGIPVGPGVDGARVDALTAEVEACMGVKVRGCGIHAVMLAPDWRDVGGSQVFPCKDGLDNLCNGVNQFPATLVVTPDLHAYKWELVRMLIRGTPTRCF